MSAGQNVIIISDDVLQRQRLRQALNRYGVAIAFISDPERFSERCSLAGKALRLTGRAGCCAPSENRPCFPANHSAIQSEAAARKPPWSKNPNNCPAC